MKQYNRSTLGETFNHTKADERDSNKWVLISMFGMVLIVFVFEMFCMVYDWYTKTP